MTTCIDDAFIAKWHPKYEETEHDESRYQSLLALVSVETSSSGTISRQTFERIFEWKTKNRPRRFLRLDAYGTLYGPPLGRCLKASPAQKLDELLASTNKLPGIDAPTASTMVHFMHPDSMPIMDVRTVQVLHAFGYISSQQTSLQHYEEFRKAIEGILKSCPTWTLRQVDRALFAYHKRFLARKTPLKKSCSP